MKEGRKEGRKKRKKKRMNERKKEKKEGRKPEYWMIQLVQHLILFFFLTFIYF